MREILKEKIIRISKLNSNELNMTKAEKNAEADTNALNQHEICMAVSQ